MIVAWLVLPALLVGLSLGVGLLVESLAGRRLPGELLLPAGLAGIVVAGQATASFDPTAELTTPLIVALALGGLAAALRRHRRLRSNLAATLACLFCGLVFAAPVIASGEPTFGGYIRLDDTSTWLALTDRIIEHGRSLEGLAPSSYEATLAFNLGDGYPIGVFVPLGVGGELTGADTARLIQPYMSVLAAFLALALIPLARRLAGSQGRAAMIAAIAAQPALLVGYVQWGGIKEVAAAMLVALAAALAVRFARPRARRRPPLVAMRAALPLAIASAALLAVLSAGGAIWLSGPLALALVLAWRRAGGREAVSRAITVGLLSAALVLPAIVTGAVLPPTSSPLTSDTAQGNLFEPLELAQLAGIWPAGDFRADPFDVAATDTLVLVVLGAAVIGLAIAVRRRAGAALVYILGTLAACGLILVLGSPWVDGKAMATAAPALLLAGLGGALAVFSGGPLLRRALGAAALLAIVTGVLWSNALAYREVSLAPHEQLAELERIGELIAGEGPALMTEYQPYGVRHFLRNADPEGVSELRRRLTPLRNGESVPKGVNADTDELSPTGLFVYPTLVLRRSPVQSRPPGPYELVWSGEYYEVWQRPAGAGDEVAHRLALGDGLDPTGVLECRDLVRLVRFEPGGTVTAARRSGTAVAALDDAEHPAGWGQGVRTVIPTGDGSARGSIDVPAAGSWSVWLGGSIRGRVELLLDGRPVGSARHLLNNYGFFIGFGTADLVAGRHDFELRFSAADLHPGSGGRQEPVGPLILGSSEPAEAELVVVPTADATKLCDRRWDWIEISDE